MLSSTPLYWDPSGAATAAGGTGTWDTSTAEWRSGSPTGSLVAWSNSGDANGPYAAIFPSTGGVVTLGAAVTAVSVSFAADGYSVNGGTGGNGLMLSGGIGQIDVTPDSTATISASVSAGPGLTKTNTGILNLTGTVSGTTAQTLNVEQGSLSISTSESWQTVEMGTTGTLITDGASAGLIVSGGITVEGAFYNEGGTVEAQTLAIDSTGTLIDSSGSISGSVSNLAITNNGTFDSVTDQSLNGTTGTFVNSGIYKVDNASGSGTTTLSTSFTDSNGTIDVTGGTLSIPGSITLPSGTSMTLDGMGTIAVPSLDDIQSTIQQNSGTLSISQYLDVGSNWVSGAQYTLSGGSLDAGWLSIGGSSTATFTQTGGSLVTGHTEVGTYGNGTLVQSGGTSSFYDLYFGVSGQGTFDLDGGSSSSAYSITVGTDGGNAAIDLSGAATLASANGETIGETGATGSFTQSGTSTNTVGGGGLDIGSGGTGSYTISGGTIYSDWFGLGGGINGNGTFIQSGGEFFVTYGSSVGSDSSTSYGTYQISGGLLYTSYNFDVGINGGHGNFTETGGTVDFANGSLIAGVGGTSATINLSGGSLAVSDNTYIGYSSSASAVQTGGTFNVSGDLFVSGDGWDNAPNGIGSFELSGSAQLNTNRTIVGFTADGTFNQSGGSHTFTWLILDGANGSVATYNNTGGTRSDGIICYTPEPSATGASVVNEGSPYTLNMSAWNPVFWYSYVSSWSIGWGDGVTDSLPGNPSSANHTYYNSSSYTINATAVGYTQNYSTAALNVFVNDVPATIAPITAQSVNTGSSLSISTTFTDPGIYETHSGFINWGDGSSSALSVNGSNGTISASHTYNVHGNYTPEIQLTDSGGAVAMSSFNVDALYVAPSVAVVTPTDAIVEGTASTFQLHDYGPETTGVASWNINWGDGTTQTINQSAGTLTTTDAEWDVSHTYAQTGHYNVSAVAYDSAGAHAASIQTVSVQPPPGLVIDILAANGSNSASVTSVGQTISLNVWATVTGSNSSGSDDGLQSVAGSFISAMGSDGSVQGDLSDSVNADDFGASGASEGTQQDLNGDGNLDVGSDDGSSIAGYMNAKAAYMLTGTVDGASDEFLIATLNFKVTSLPTGGGETDINFYPRPVVGAGYAAVWMQDGKGENETTSTLSAGTPFRINAGAEPVLAAVQPAISPAPSPPPAPIPSALSGSTTVALTGGGSFIIAYDSSSGTYNFSQGGVSVASVLASNLEGFTYAGGTGTTASLTISGSGADPILLNDAGSVGTNISVTVDSGAAITFETSEHLTSLTIDSGATATMAANGQSVLATNTLSIAGSTDAWTGTLDLSDNGLIVHGGSLTTITNQIKSGCDGGSWAGTSGIISTSAALDSTRLTALGSIPNENSTSAAIYTTFDGQAVSTTDILVQYTYYGDNDLSGNVDGNDYSLIDYNYQSHLSGWLNGDYNYDGTVDGSDYTLIDNAFNSQGAPIIDGGAGVLPAPRNLTVTTFSSTEIDLSWIDDASSADAAGDDIYVSTDNGTTFSFFDEVNAVAAGSTNTYQATGLNPGSEYKFYVTAEGEYAESAASNIVTQSTTVDPPSAPGYLRAPAVSSSELDLTWINATSSAVENDIYISTDGINFSYLGKTTADGTSYDVNGLDAATTYYFEVAAVNAGGTGVSDVESGTTLSITTPASLSENVISSTEIDLSWNDSANDNSAYEVDYSTDGSTYQELDIVAAGTNTYQAVNLTPGTEYYFTVTSLADNGSSDASNVISTQTLPAAPSGLSANRNADGSVTLSWNPVPGAGGYTVQRKTAYYDWSDLSYPTTATYTDDPISLSPVTSYRVYATCYQGNSNFSSSVDVATNPFAPQGLIAMSDPSVGTTVDLSWPQPSGPVDSFIIERSTDPNFGTYDSISVGGNAYSDSGLNTDTTYYYELVVHTDQSGDSNPSTPASITTAPAAPSGLTAVGVSPTAINLTWVDNSTTENQFEIDMSTDGGTTWTSEFLAAANAEHYTAAISSPSIAYTFRVKAIGPTAASLASNIVTAYGSTPANLVTGLFNTGVDANGNPLPIGSSDPHYTPGYVPQPISSWVPNGASEWIDPSAGDQFAPGNYSYTTTFNIPSGVTLTGLTLSGTWSSDNRGLEIDLNGVSTGISNLNDNAYSALTPFVISSGLVTGQNTLKFTILNDQSSTAPSPTGLRVDGMHLYYATAATTVSIAATVGSAVIDDSDETVSTGQFTISRTGDTSSALSVPFVVSGVPRPGADYQLSSGTASYGGIESVTIPAGQTSTGITLTPQESFIGNSPAILSIWGSSAYAIGNKDASVNISHSQIVATLSTDMNNDGQITPADDPIKSDPTAVGKILQTDDGDDNGNGVPDYADGFSLDSAAATSVGTSGNYFAPLQISIAGVSDLTDATIQLDYASSDPSLVTRTGNGSPSLPYVYTLPTVGYLRIWTMDGTQLRDPDAVNSSTDIDGNFVPADTDLTPAEIGMSADGTATLFVERVKTDTAGPDFVKLTVTVDGLNYIDTVWFSSVDFQQVQANADGSVTLTNSTDASDLIPTFANLNMSIGNIGFDPTHHFVIGDITISGDVSSALGNLTPGDDGTIKSVIVYPNEDHSVGYSIAVTGTKKTSGTTLLDPYDFSGHFSETFDDVDVDYGDYSVDVAAIDPVSHESATETLTATVSGMATDGLVNIPNPNPRLWQQYTDVEFDSDPGLQDPDYTAPEFHGYLLQLVGSPEVLSGVSTITTAAGTFPVQQFSDGNYYAYSINSSGGATVPMVMHLQPVSTDWNPTVPQPADDDNSTASFVEGLAVGFGSGFPSLVSGTWTLIKAIPGAIADYNPWTLAYNYSDRYCSGDTFDTEKSFISATGSALSKVSDIVTQLATDPDLIQALLTGDTNTVGELSPDLQATLTTVAELLVKLQDQFAGLSKYDQGRIIGRTIFEVGNLVAGGELLKLGKAGLLKSLSNIKFFQECAPVARALAALQPQINKVAQAAASLFLIIGSSEEQAFEGLYSIYRYLVDTKNMDPFSAFKQMLAWTTNGKLDDGLAYVSEQFTKEVYAAANGDPSKVPTYSQLYDALQGRAGAAMVDSHHAATRQWARQLLEGLPQYSGYTDAQWKTLLDSMPAAALGKVSHGTLGVGGNGFHQILGKLLTNGKEYPSDIILTKLQQAYTDWDPVEGPQIWAVARQWLLNQGVK